MLDRSRICLRLTVGAPCVAWIPHLQSGAPESAADDLASWTSGRVRTVRERAWRHLFDVLFRSLIGGSSYSPLRIRDNDVRHCMPLRATGKNASAGRRRRSSAVARLARSAL